MSDDKVPPTQAPEEAKGVKPSMWKIDTGETPAQKEIIDYHNHQNALRRAGIHVPSVLDMKAISTAKRKPPGAI